jgi:photosystem II stability/assembly factor-like uncharacterized protein
MTELSTLEDLYIQARALIKQKDSAAASALLKQILEVDESYKDASRLLASIVQKKRYRWYRDYKIWAGATVLILGVAFIFLLTRETNDQNIPPAITLKPIVGTVIETEVITPTPTLNPNLGRFSWKRINSAKQMERENISSLAIYPKDTLIMYAATENAGLYKTIDGGKSWSPTLYGLEETGFKKILVSDTNPQDLLALSDGENLYTSVDGGTSWVYSSLNSGYDTRLIIQDPSNGQHLISRQNDTLSESQNFGQTWTPISTPVCPSDFFDIKIDSLNNKELTAIQVDDSSSSCPGGIYRSMDGGKTWGISGLSVTNLMSLEISGNYIYTLTGRTAELYVSPDRGFTWQGPFLPNNERCDLIGVDSKNGQKAFCLQNSIGIEQTKIWETSDAGLTWRDLSELDINGTSITIPSFAPEKIIVAGSGLEVSSDRGSTWEAKQSGLASRTFELIFDPSDSTLLYAYETRCAWCYSSLFLSRDNGSTFEMITKPGISDFSGLSIGFGGIIYRWQYFDYISSSDQGKTWKIWNQTIQPDFVWAMGANPKVEGLLLATVWNFDAIYRSTDGGANWSETKNSIGGHENYYFAGENGNRVYAPVNGQLSRSDDAGESWIQCSPNIIGMAKSASSMAVDPTNTDTIYLATQGYGVLKSTAGCLSTQSINIGLDNLNVNSIAVDPNDPLRLFAGTAGGAYLSLNGGNSWFPVNDGLLGATIIYSIAVNPTDSTVLAATPYGIFILTEK